MINIDPASAELDRHLTLAIQELKGVPRMPSPNVIQKLHDRANRAKSLLKETEVTADKSDEILDSYEQSLRLYQSGLSQVKANDDVLRTLIKDMGNYAGDIGDTFREDKDKDKADPKVDTKPEEPAPPPPEEVKEQDGGAPKS